jgi:hypothetical protein
VSGNGHTVRISAEFFQEVAISSLRKCASNRE